MDKKLKRVAIGAPIDAEIKAYILRMICGDKLELAEKSCYNIRIYCGE
jgi:hypothetical protein